MCQFISVRHTMSPVKRTAAASGAQRGRATLQATTELPQAMSKGSALSERCRRPLRASTRHQRSQIASAATLKSEPDEIVSMSMSKEEQAEQKVMAALALAVEDKKSEQGRGGARRGKRALDTQSAPVSIKQEHVEDGAQSERKEETDGSKSTTGRSIGRKVSTKSAQKAEQQDEHGVSAEPKKRRKVAQSLQAKQAAGAEDTPEAKPKQKRQRKLKSDQARKEQMPDVPEAKQRVRKAAAATPRRRKAAERLDAGMHLPVRPVAA